MVKQTIVIFGGSSGIGEATARLACEGGARVLIVGRDRSRLDAAVMRTGAVQGFQADAGDRVAVEEGFARVGAVDHVVLSVGGGRGAGAFSQVDLADVQSAFAAKTLAQLTTAQVAARHLRSGGSITFISGAAGRSVIRGTAGLAAVNAAIDAVVPILALELAPTRVNAVSPGVVDTPWWEAIPGSAKRELFARAADTLPVGRVAAPPEIAQAVLFVINSGFCTGSVYEIDGGGRLAMH